MDNKNEIGERIKQVIAEQGITQAEFAQRLNISQSMVSKICSGAAEPSFRTLSDISEKFSIDLVWLDTGYGDMHHKQTIAEQLIPFYARVMSGHCDPIQLEFAIALYQTPVKDLVSIKKFAKLLLEAEKVKDPYEEYFEDLADKETAPDEDPEQQTEKAPDATNIQD